jgi:hypothetical protein
MLRRLKGHKLIILSALIMSLLIMVGCSSNNDDDSVEDKSYSVSGKVVDINENGAKDVILSFTNGNGTATTKKQGEWSKDQLKGKGVVTPAKTGYKFSPESREISKQDDNVDFIAKKVPATYIEAFCPDYNSSQADSNGAWIDIKFNDVSALPAAWLLKAGNYKHVNELMNSTDISGWSLNNGDTIRVYSKGAKVNTDETDLKYKTASKYFANYQYGIIWLEDEQGTIIDIVAYTTSSNSKGYWLSENGDNPVAILDKAVVAEKWNGSKLADAFEAGDISNSYIKLKDVVVGDGQKNSDWTTVDEGDGENLPDGAVSAEIYEIQGSSHESAMKDEPVKGVDGIVTAKDKTGFYMQELDSDNDDATSEAIYVLSDKAVEVGDKVIVAGIVQEYAIPHTADEWWIDIPRQLTITAIEASQVEVQSHGNDLPNPIILGTDRSIPENSIDDDSFDSFDITEDAIDFYESLEGMRVQVDNALVIGPTEYGQTAVLPNSGDYNSGARTEFGGVLIAEGDFNPERIIVEAETLTKFFDYRYAKSFDLGAKFIKPIVGIISYDEGKYMLYNTADYSSYSEDDIYTKANNSKKDVTTINYAKDKLTIASFNVENLSAESKSSKIEGIANSIVTNLKNPDIIGLVEIQDNNGETDNGVVVADKTYNALISTISNVGGATYDYVNIDPEDDQDGGAPGGNIRVGFIYRTDRVNFIAKGSATATDDVLVEGSGENITLSLNPGRIDPTNNAFDDSRKPLAAEFEFKGEKVFMIANHFNSKGGDAPLFGNEQPPVLVSENQRREQAEVVNQFVQEILAANSDANVVVLGDLNDFQFSEAVDTLAGSQLTNMMEQLDDSDRFTYVYEGNSQVLDHILVSDSLVGSTEVDAIHINSVYAEYGPIGIVSDHDPIMVQISNLGN